MLKTGEIPLTPPPPPNGLAQDCRYSPKHDWAPPASLLDILSDDDDLLAELLHTFRTDVETRMKRMRESLAAANFPLIRADAHTIKGSARQMGAGLLGAACQEIEMVSDLEAATLMPDRIRRAQELCEEVCAAMTSYVTRGQRRSS